MKKVWHIIKAVLAALVAVLAWVFLGKRKVEPVKTEREEELEQRVDDLKERQRRRKAKIGGTLILLLFLSFRPVGATDWESLYRETEKDLDEALAIIEEYQEILEAKNREIERLSRPVWGITAGIDLADSAGWRLGVARKKGWLSLGGGIGGGDGFSVWGSVTLWLMNPF